ncbi:MAG: protein rep, partial [Nitrospiraceae bacterium]
MIAESLDRTGQSWNRRQAFIDCGSHAYVMRSVEDPEKHRIAGSCCHDRFCLPCAKGRAHTIAGNVLEHIRKVEIRFLTLTIRTEQEPLIDQLGKLYKCFAALRRSALWKRKVDGGVAFVEVKWSTSGTRWHPHLHCLIQGRWFDKRRLSVLWHKITGDSYIVDIQRPKDDEQVLRYVT